MSSSFEETEPSKLSMHIIITFYYYRCRFEYIYIYLYIDGGYPLQKLAIDAIQRQRKS